MSSKTALTMKSLLIATAAGGSTRRHRLPAVLMRAGTSRGLFLHRRDMPQSETDWGPVLVAAMGSRNNDPRQLEGVGGATSTTSKVVVVNPSTRPGIDVDYTFVQVAVGAEVVDMTGNCGNMASGIAAFALDEGLVTAKPGCTETTVRIYNTNTQVIIEETIQVDLATGLFREDGEYRISGVKSSGSLVKVKFVSPGGSMTGKTFPTGHRQEIIRVSDGSLQFEVSATLIDVSNPFVFVDAKTMPAAYHAQDANAEEALAIIESIRRQASVMYGFAANTETAGLQRGTPKISLLSPADDVAHSSASGLGAPAVADIRVLSYSMGKVHPSFQLTGAVCLGAATCLEGTVAAAVLAEKRTRLPPTPPGPISPNGSPAKDIALEVANKVLENVASETGRKIVIQHRSGTLDVEVDIADGGQDAAGVTVYRTAKRVFEGCIYV
ncbi:PrpF protein [Niveomyces insectorum RCEF 264]|uniref:PrpF protein n=1 Tax=Niveomyces insectorum RCEF 264 TaxID=1081102 RepID=A0A167RTM6_9HYPO|nr:PrpF protein [Niveomyces insectorum RCEF 264]